MSRLTRGIVLASNHPKIPLIPILRRLGMKYTETDLHPLAARLERLEAQNRRWKLSSSLIALFGVSFFLMGAKPADRIEPSVLRAATVEAQEFILKDEDGHVHARLGLNSSLLTIKQPNGVIRIVPNQLVPGQAALQFYDERGQVLWTVPSNPTMIPVK
jgi:hypothetical protein